MKKVLITEKEYRMLEDINDVVNNNLPDRHSTFNGDGSALDPADMIKYRKRDIDWHNQNMNADKKLSQIKDEFTNYFVKQMNFIIYSIVGIRTASWYIKIKLENDNVVISYMAVDFPMADKLSDAVSEYVKKYNNIIIADVVLDENGKIEDYTLDKEEIDNKIIQDLGEYFEENEESIKKTVRYIRRKDKKSDIEYLRAMGENPPRTRHI